MTTSLVLRCETETKLVRHVAGQLRVFYPLSDEVADRELIAQLMPAALARIAPIVAAVRSFTPGHFDHLNTLQYASFLYLLGNEACQWDRGSDIVDRLFGLNRALSGLELFPAVLMPEVFFLSHALGAVLGNATYGDRIVIFQNVTVGRVGENRPDIGPGVVLYPGASITGRCEIGANSVISAGVNVHNLTCPPGSLVKAGGSGVAIEPLQRDYLSIYYR